MALGSGHDAVVIGAGAGGAAAAWRLCQFGLRVLLLEAGPAFDPPVDYPHDRPGWERHAFPDPPGSRSEVAYGNLGTLDPGDGDLASWSRAGFPWRQPDGAPRPPAPAGYHHVRGVGGTTLHFVGEQHRLHPDAFRLSSLTGEGVDWPITYADLEPHYAMAEAVQGVAGAEEAAAGGRWRSAAFPLPPHPPGPGARVLMAAGARLGQNWEVNPRATLSAPRDGRPSCNYCGQCTRGCPLGDKGSVDVTFLRQAAETGRLDLVSGAIVTRLHAGPGGRITRLDAVVDGRLHSVETPLVLLAAGAVETPRLLLLSADAAAPDGLANSSGEVGRNFMEMLNWQGTGLVEGLTGSHYGLPDDVICWDMAAPGRVPGLAGGFVLKHATIESGFNGPIAYATRLLPGFGPAFKAAMRRRFGSALCVEAVGQVIPDARSRVTLDAQRRDALGLPVARIDSVLTAQGLALLRRMAAAVRALLAEAGAEIVEESGSRDAFTAAHAFGTARMGKDPATSVVGADLGAHDHPNLWIADASVMPSSGGGESPSLTIMALALRAADAMAGALPAAAPPFPPAP